MKTYTVIQSPNYQELTTTNKAEAEAKLKEMQDRCASPFGKKRWYICEQGLED
jgi:GTP cyclohydrolase III